MLNILPFVPTLIWVGAAAAVAPYFMPDANSISLFVVRLVAGLALLLVATGAFHIREQPHMCGVRLAVHIVTAAVVVAIGLAVANRGMAL
ncbi:hypothetical protein QE369_000744 [Agrobacterium larrymoorei]|uniref:Uncharacterized protein n=1 Tax=Agrobacterium larrymoorei TaxID=160699 RepID=A0AAJ2BCR2_9HYPH|nr:hypothetical protein [Agrobacterium larrymoorei]MDR6100566.1 hypothetical protein [Agrobacterium larrymoorei]